MVAIDRLIVSSPETPFGEAGDSGLESKGGEPCFLAFTATKLATLANAGG